MLGRTCFAVTAGALLMLTAAVAAAEGVAYTVTTLLGPEAELQQLSLGTGAATPVGTLELRVTGLAFDSTGNLFGVDASTDQLAVIDRTTAGSTAVGPLGVDVLAVSGLTFDHTDRLWMSAFVAEVGPSLWEVDPVAGNAAYVAEIPPENLGALACLGETVYMASAALVVVETTTGKLHAVVGSDLGIWAARALDRGAGGDLRGLMLCMQCETPLEVLQLQGVDPVTGNAVAIGPYVMPSTWGLAIVPGGLFYDGFESEDTAGWAQTSD